VRQAYSLNTPLVVQSLDRVPTSVADVGAAPLRSFLQCDAPNVIVTTVKQAEDDPNAWVVRLYDWEGKASDVTLTFPFEVASAEITGIMEDPGKAVAPKGKSVTIPVGAYAIETVKVVKKG